MKERADKILTDRGLVASRSQAKSMIEKGDVTFNGKVITKAGELLGPDVEIVLSSPAYVGRGAFKLERALTEFAVNPTGKVFLDVGASTGGFTEILLREGATKVYAIDVGADQLAEKLRTDPRVVNLNRTNIRDLHELPELAAGAVMDLSFISITKVLENVSKLLGPAGLLIALVKPQFEAGRERLPKDGVVKDPKVRATILAEVIAFATAHGWTHLGSIESPIEGKNGNVEFLIYMSKS